MDPPETGKCGKSEPFLSISKLSQVFVVVLQRWLSQHWKNKLEPGF
jgi:hypothetical protein